MISTEQKTFLLGEDNAVIAMKESTKEQLRKIIYKI